MGKKKKNKKPVGKPPAPETKEPKMTAGSDPHSGEGVRELFGTCDPEDGHFKP